MIRDTKTNVKTGRKYSSNKRLLSFQEHLLSDPTLRLQNEKIENLQGAKAEIVK